MAPFVLPAKTSLPSGLPCSHLDCALPLLQSWTLQERVAVTAAALLFASTKVCGVSLCGAPSPRFKPAKHSAEVVPPLLSWVCLLQSQEPSQQEVAQKEQLIASLNRLVQPGLGEYTGMHVEPYGSFTSGLSNQGGDLDLAVEGRRTGRG